MCIGTQNHGIRVWKYSKNSAQNERAFLRERRELMSKRGNGNTSSSMSVAVTAWQAVTARYCFMLAALVAYKVERCENA